MQRRGVDVVVVADRDRSGSRLVLDRCVVLIVLRIVVRGGSRFRKRDRPADGEARVRLRVKAVAGA